MTCRWCENRDEESSAAVAVFTGACVNEHIREFPVCERHLSEAQGLSLGRDLYCHLCKRYGAHTPVIVTGVRMLEQEVGQS